MSYESYPPPHPEPSAYGAPIAAGDPAVAPLRGATPQQAAERFFKRYALFRGRASRSEFWWWELIAFCIAIVLAIVAAVIGTGILTDLWGLATICPSLALGARRLHDTNRSGWWQLLVLIPIVGWIILIVWWASMEKPEGARYDAA